MSGQSGQESQNSQGDLASQLELTEAIVFGENGLLPAIIQDDEGGDVLMLAWMDREAVRRTLTTGRVTFWSRSRQEYWRKGDTSGHRQYVRSVAMDCDGDTLLVQVVQVGAACHTGTRTCFSGRALEVVIGDPTQDEVGAEDLRGTR